MLDDCIFTKEPETIGVAPSSLARPGGLYITNRAVEFCGFTAGDRVADIGCGSCGTLEYLLTTYGICGFGLDPAPMILAVGAQGMQRPSVVRGIAEALPFKNSLLDGLFCECVLSLVDDLDAALQEFSRVLKKGGHLIISDLYYRTSTDGSRLDRPYGQSNIQPAISKRRMKGLLEAHGFNSLLWEDHTRALKELVVQLIFAGQSPEDFWKQSCRDCAPSPPGRSIISAKPGYCLVIARCHTS